MAKRSAYRRHMRAEAAINQTASRYAKKLGVGLGTAGTLAFMAKGHPAAMLAGGMGMALGALAMQRGHNLAKLARGQRLRGHAIADLARRARNLSKDYRDAPPKSDSPGDLAWALTHAQTRGIRALSDATTHPFGSEGNEARSPIGAGASSRGIDYLNRIHTPLGRYWNLRYEHNLGQAQKARLGMARGAAGRSAAAQKAPGMLSRLKQKLGVAGSVSSGLVKGYWRQQFGRQVFVREYQRQPRQ